MVKMREKTPAEVAAWEARKATIVPQRRPGDSVAIRATLIGETEKARRIQVGTKKIWVPASVTIAVMAHNHGKNRRMQIVRSCTIIVERWWAKNNYLLQCSTTHMPAVGQTQQIVD